MIDGGMVSPSALAVADRVPILRHWQHCAMPLLLRVLDLLRL
jgi:hypothetical protein